MQNRHSLLLLVFCAACTSPAELVPEVRATPEEVSSSPDREAAEPAPGLVSFDPSPYPWLSSTGDSPGPIRSLEARFPPPEGFRRLPASSSSFGAWLRGLPLRTDRTEVLAYDGTPLDRPSAAVVLMDVGDRDLMQCADSLIRLHAEFLWAKGRADEAGYRFTSGDLSRWSDWKAGERFVIEGSKVGRRKGAAREDDHRSFRRWLDLIFTYAGTASLARDTPPVAQGEELQAGDFFVDPGFPGHAVMLLDIAVDDSGRRVALVGQGFMPAEEVHVVQSSAALDRVWFPLPEAPGEVLDTPSWEAFQRSAARRFP